MKKEEIYKKIVLGILFVFPLLVYLFFASGKNNFAKLPILSEKIMEIPQNNSKVFSMLNNHITILGYWGGSLENKKAEALNLNEKIYKRFYQFNDFQFVFLVDSDKKQEVEELKSSLKQGVGTNLSRWNFVTGNRDSIYNIAKSYLLVAEKGINSDHGGFIHSGDFVLIDNKGRIRSGYDTNGNPIGAYDGTSAQSVKDLIVDVGVLVKEIKREKQSSEKR